MDYKLISALVAAGYDNAAIDKILAAVPPQTPVQQTPGQYAPVQQTPVQYAPVQQTPVQHAPVQQTPIQYAPVQQPPVQQTPAQYAPVQQPPVQQPPVQYAPVQQPPVQQTPVQYAPVQQPPVQQPPVQQTPPVDVNADLSRRMLSLMRDMQSASGFGGTVQTHAPKTAEDVSLDILNAGGDS